MEEDYIGFDNPVKYLSQDEHCNDNPKRTEPFVGKTIADDRTGCDAFLLANFQDGLPANNPTTSLTGSTRKTTIFPNTEEPARR